MPKRKMTRKQCENEILKRLKEIQEIYKQYHPNGDYLSISIGNDCISMNNAYWEENDEKNPLNFYEVNGRKGSIL